MKILLLLCFLYSAKLILAVVKPHRILQYQFGPDPTFLLALQKKNTEEAMLCILKQVMRTLVVRWIGLLQSRLFNLKWSTLQKDIASCIHTRFFQKTFTHFEISPKSWQFTYIGLMLHFHTP